MNNYEIQKALQLRNQRFVAALKFATTQMEYGERPSIDEAIKMAYELIAKLEAPTL